MTTNDYISLKNQLLNQLRINELNRTEIALLTYFLQTLEKTTVENEVMIDFTSNIHSVIVSQNVLADVLNVQRQTIYNAINRLIEKQFIAVGKSGNASIYVILPQIAFKSMKMIKGKLSVLTKMVLTKSENEDLEHEYKYMNGTTILDKSSNEVFFTMYDKFNKI